MKKLIIITICILFASNIVQAGLCYVDTQADTDSGHTLRHQAERDLIEKCSIDATNYPDGSVADAWIAFFTPEACSSGDATCDGDVRRITLAIKENGKVLPIEFNAASGSTVLVGNFSSDMLADSELNYDSTDVGHNDGQYVDDTNDGKIDDMGFIIVDGSDLEEGVSPFTCVHNDSSVFSRETIFVTNKAPWSKVFSGCVKNGGANKVCMGKLATEYTDGNFDPQVTDAWCDGRLSTAEDDNVETDPEFSPENLQAYGVLPINHFIYCKDRDGDSYYTKGIPLLYPRASLEAQGYKDCNDLTANESIGDCNDKDESIHPGASEIANDGIDQDCNGADLIVESVAEDCSDSIDNDDDGLIDCEDTDCSTATVCIVESTETDCSNALDDDGDSLVDCTDPDCSSATICVAELTETNCSNALDDDGDSLVDCADPDCANDVSCLSYDVVETSCGDGLDDDNDSFIDCDDSDCYGILNETTGEVCPDPSVNGDPSSGGGGCGLGSQKSSQFGIGSLYSMLSLMVMLFCTRKKIAKKGFDTTC